MGEYDGRVKFVALNVLKTLCPVPLDGSFTATNKSGSLLHDASDQKMFGRRRIVSNESDGAKLLCRARPFVGGFARVRPKSTARSTL